MEQYSYYGSGRYFAVTNAYPPTSEVYNVVVGSKNFSEKPGDIDAQELGSNRREGYEHDTIGNESQNAELDKEPPSHERSVYDNNMRNREDEARWRYKDMPSEGHNVWEPESSNGRDINSNLEPQVEQQLFVVHPMHGRGHEQVLKEYEAVDNEKIKKEYNENERIYELPEPTLYHDRYSEDAGEDVGRESGKERYKSNNSTVNEENKAWKNGTVDQLEHQKPTDVADDKFQKSIEKLGLDDQSNIYNDLQISEKPKYPEPYQGKEIEKSREVRPDISINKYDTSQKDKLFGAPERSSEKWRNKGIDDKLLYFKNREKEHAEQLGQQQKGTGDYRKPSTARQGDQKIPATDRDDAKSFSQMYESRKIRGYEDMQRNRDNLQSYPIPNRYVGGIHRPNEENKYQREVAEQGRSKTDKAKLPDNEGNYYVQKNAEKKSKMTPHENFAGKPIEQVNDVEDIREDRKPQYEASANYAKYNDQPQEDFEIDVDEVYESKEEINVQNANPIEEEIIHEEFHEIESEPMALEVLDDDYEEENDDNDDDDDWPLPPEDKIILQEEKELIKDHDTSEARRNYLQKQKNEIASKENGSLYTSFLTIDVTSGKRESLDGPTLSDSKHRSSLLNLVTFNQELEHAEDNVELDKEDMDKIRHDVEMISKYLHNIPLGASHWPQNYDVLRDLVKLYLASKTTSSATLNYLLDYFLKLDWPGLFLKCLRRIMKSYPQVFVHASDKKIPFEDPTPETLDMTRVSLEYAVAVIFQVILSLAAEFTEIHTQSKNEGYKGFVNFIFQELLPKLHGIPWGQSTAREEFLHSSIDILYNYSQSTTNIGSFYECNAVDVLINFRRETDYIGGNRVNIGALLTLSFLLDDRNNQTIFTDSAPISLLIHYVQESLSKIDHCYADFCLSELIDGLTRIASHDQNKQIICSHGGVNAIAAVLRESKDDEELSSVCRLIWSVCFVEKCKQRIIKRSPEVIQFVRDLQKSKNIALRQLAESLIWEFEGKYSDSNQSGKSKVEHIFISYHAENRSEIVKISERLKDKGYRVWLEKSKGESYAKHTTEAVENAAIVIVAVSRKYKQSPSVFAEADYAFRLCKPMIPIILERNYKPDGWLGMLVGSKVWLDMTQESKFEGHMQILIRQIGERGKTERAFNLPYIDESRKNPDYNPDKSASRLIDISRWGNEEVIEWLQQKNLKSCVPEEKIKKLRGPHLLQLHHLRRESPDFYYNSLEPQLGFTDVIDMMEFTQALEALAELQ